MPDWEALQQTIAGDVLTPDAAGYEEARKPAIARFHDVRPQAVVRCRAAEDVSEAIAFAGDLPVAARSGGHCFAGRSTTTGMVIDVGPLDSVSVSDGVATVGAGAKLGAVYDALLGHGVTIAAGCGPEVGIAGLTLGGGLGIMGRRDGLTSDQLLGAEVVLADGRLVTCDEEREQDLFWALRGAGGGHFGVATSFTFRTVAAPEATAFDLRWERATTDLVQAWQACGARRAGRAGGELVDHGRPGPRRAAGGQDLRGDARRSGRDRGGARAGWIRRAPTSCTARTARPSASLAGAGEPDDERHPYCRSHYVRGTLPGDTIAALLRHLEADRRPGEARELDFSPWGGAYNRVPADATAFAHRDARFLLKLGAVLEPGVPPTDWLNRAWEIVRPWGTGGVYVNFPEPGAARPGSVYWGTNRGRMLEVKRRYGF